MQVKSWPLELAWQLNQATNQADRFDGLIATFSRLLPFDAACLFLKNNDMLKPLSTFGLAGEVRYRTFPIAEHPRLETVTKSEDSVIFSPRCTLPDPFDGLLNKDQSGQLKVHACLGIPLMIEGKLIGVLTADSLTPGSFEKVDLSQLKLVAAFAAAALRTSLLLEKFEAVNQTQGLIQHSSEKTVSEEHTFIGESSALATVRKTIAMVAPTDISVLVSGETGTGKEVVIRQIHIKSQRSREALIYINCAALPESLAESELFGHKKGAFTGAHTDRMGKLEMGHRGTVFLDEIGELSPLIQSKLLRFLQEGEIQKVGSDHIKKVDVRVIAATNRDLQTEMSQGRFRKDLYHRLNAFPLYIPPLRERRSDIIPIAQFFCSRYEKKFGTPPVRCNEGFNKKLMDYPWHGNVRELKNVIARAILSANHRAHGNSTLCLTEADLELGVSGMVEPLEISVKAPDPMGLSLRDATNLFQKQYIYDAWLRHDRNWAQAAKDLGVHRANLHQMAKRLEILEKKNPAFSVNLLK